MLMNKRRNVYILALSAGFASFGFNFYQPNLPLFALDLGIDIALLGLLFTISSLINVPIILYAGVVADKYGRKPLVTLGYFFAALGAGIALLSYNPLLLSLSIIFFTLSFSIGMTSRSVLIAESVPIEFRGRAMSAVSMGFSLPSIFSPFIGGYIASNLGFRVVFMYSTISYIICTLLVLLFVRETLRDRSDTTTFTEVNSILRFKKELLPLYPLVIMDRIGWALWMQILNAHLAELYSIGAWEIGILTSIRNAAWFLSLYPFGKLSDRLGRWQVLVSSELFSIAAVLILAFGSNIYWVTLAWVFIGLAIASWIPSFNSILADLTSEVERAKEMSKIYSIRTLAEIPMPGIGGYLHETLDPSAPFIISAIIISSGTIYFLLQSPEKWYRHHLVK